MLEIICSNSSGPARAFLCIASSPEAYALILRDHSFFPRGSRSDGCRAKRAQLCSLSNKGHGLTVRKSAMAQDSTRLFGPARLRCYATPTRPTGHAGCYSICQPRPPICLLRRVFFSANALGDSTGPAFSARLRTGTTQYALLVGIQRVASFPNKDRGCHRE